MQRTYLLKTAALTEKGRERSPLFKLFFSILRKDRFKLFSFLFFCLFITLHMCTIFNFVILCLSCVQVLTLLINSAYKPSRVLRELQLDQESRWQGHGETLKAK